MRYLITFTYDGSNFNGYQKQPRKRTVQGVMEECLKEINGGKVVNLHASGRTDALVHALNQKAHFDLDIKITPNKLYRGLNSLLPDDIYIKKVEEVSDNFHARFDAIGKEYIYKINMGEYNPIERNYVFQYCQKLDIVAMQRAISYFEGEHNFKSFTKANDEIEDYVRKISQTSIVRDSKNLNEIVITFVGTGFMRYMVRNMVGLLIEVGEGKRKSEDVIEILKHENRSFAGKTAPACGLYLRNVFY